MDRLDRVHGTLLGTALGDALGLPYEGLALRRIPRWANTERFRLLGRTGFVSDDTEQTALLAHALVAGRGNDDDVVCRFRRSLVGWFLRLPFGIGGATLRACTRMALGVAHPGVRSAGNGAAMRSGILGVLLSDDPQRRRALASRIARLTHTDARATDAALYVSELAALCATAEGPDRRALVREARRVVRHAELNAAIDGALAFDGPLPSAIEVLGNTGFVVHSVGLTTHCFVHHGETPLQAIQACIRAGGDTDSHAAIVGGWLGALHGASGLPMGLVRQIQNGPFGPRHLEGLARAAVEGAPLPRWSPLYALVRNLSLYPVVLAHGLLRVLLRFAPDTR